MKTSKFNFGGCCASTDIFSVDMARKRTRRPYGFVWSTLRAEIQVQFTATTHRIWL